MEIKKIIRKGMPLYVRLVKVSELDKTKCSNKFLSHNLADDILVNVKCYEDGRFDLRGKKEQYRLIMPDDLKEEKEREELKSKKEMYLKLKEEFED